MSTFLCALFFSFSFVFDTVLWDELVVPEGDGDPWITVVVVGVLDGVLQRPRGQQIQVRPRLCRGTDLHTSNRAREERRRRGGIEGWEEIKF